MSDYWIDQRHMAYETTDPKHPEFVESLEERTEQERG